MLNPEFMPIGEQQAYKKGWNAAMNSPEVRAAIDFARSFQRNLPILRSKIQEYSLAIEALDVQSQDVIAAYET